MFGNWKGGTPPDLDMQWMEILHMVYSFVFGVIMVNVLIALVSNAYMEIENERRSMDTILKIDKILEAIEIMIFWRKLFPLRKKMKDDIKSKGVKM